MALLGTRGGVFLHPLAPFAFWAGKMTRTPKSATPVRIPIRSHGELALETQLRWVGTPPWEAEYRFSPERMWRFDFAWPAWLVAVEVEGGTFSGGRHSRGAGFEADCIKYAEAAIRGWLVIRVTTEMVDDGRAVALVGRALTVRAAA